jgi:hypothetical protein
MDFANWNGLRLLIESNLIEDQFLVKVQSWPEKLFYSTATPLAYFLNNSWECLTDDEFENFARIFVEKGSSVNGIGNSLPSLLCNISLGRVSQFLIDRGAKVPKQSFLLLAVQAICLLTKAFGIVS